MGLRRDSIGRAALACALALAACGEAAAATAAPRASPVYGGPGAAATVTNQFAFDLYGRLRLDKDRLGENLFFSPFSIETALAMTYAGAAGTTAAEMAKVLHVDAITSGYVAESFAGLLRAVNRAAGGGGNVLATANALWAQKGARLLKGFLALVGSRYAAGLEEVDFARDTEGARRRINDWVSKRTEGKIPELLDPGILTPLTRLVLTNAVYFQGLWEEEFPAKSTREELFRLAGGRSVEAPLMVRKGKGLDYYADGELQALELPYQGGKLAMLVLLPRKVDGLPALEARLSVAFLSGLRLAPKDEVNVFLPRFKTASSFSLGDVLQALGMKSAFDGVRADFSGLTGKRGFYIQAVVHKAIVEVNEKGTEAAAATAVVMGPGGRAPMVEVFRADHPFLFLVRDKTTGAILFLGRVMNPLK